jgi:hypothetical protein
VTSIKRAYTSAHVLHRVACRCILNEMHACRATEHLQSRRVRRSNAKTRTPPLHHAYRLRRLTSRRGSSCKSLFLSGFVIGGPAKAEPAAEGSLKCRRRPKAPQKGPPTRPSRYGKDDREHTVPVPGGCRDVIHHHRRSPESSLLSRIGGVRGLGRQQRAPQVPHPGRDDRWRQRRPCEPPSVSRTA